MVDPRVEKLTKLCVEYSVQVKPKEEVLIERSDLAFPLIHEIYTSPIVLTLQLAEWLRTVRSSEAFQE